MRDNRRRHANTVPVAKCLATVVAVAGVGIFLVGYVWCTNDMNATGEKIKKCEQDLVQLRLRNEAARTGIGSLSSTAHLDRQFHGGLFGRLDRLERLKSAGRVTFVSVQGVSGAGAGELRRVANERGTE